MVHNTVPVITLDGPSGTGKGTISQMLAKRLGWHYLDSGALYRVLAYAAEKNNIPHTALVQLVKLAHALCLHFEVDEQDKILVFLDGVEISEAIRREQCGQNASKLASIPEIREALLDRQRKFAKLPGLVTDGRDMGTVVFPNATLKIYLDASIAERANRRYFQLKKSGNSVSLAQVVDELVQRDERDMDRSHAPLKPASDAIQIDTTNLTIIQVLDNVLQLTRTIVQSGFDG